MSILHIIASMHARKTVNNELNINYGNQAGNGQRMDLFFPSDENSKFLSKLPDFAGKFEYRNSVPGLF